MFRIGREIAAILSLRIGDSANGSAMSKQPQIPSINETAFRQWSDECVNPPTTGSPATWTTFPLHRTGGGFRLSVTVIFGPIPAHRPRGLIAKRRRCTPACVRVGPRGAMNLNRLDVNAAMVARADLRCTASQLTASTSQFPETQEILHEAAMGSACSSRSGVSPFAAGAPRNNRKWGSQQNPGVDGNQMRAVASNRVSCG